ncbi:MAG: hypothetical protein KFKLKKLM_02055 [Flavobacteriales bacterium]|nr:hypothetical protein [Flavobacteriales bacterium]
MIAKQRKKIVQSIKDKVKRASFFTFAVYFFLISITTFAPLPSYALTGGPSQPEVQSFEPVGTSDMVNLFSGDLTYNIPLLDVDGYPVNIAYTGGISADQEASWTGLGWNINVGNINRALRGLPDDFKDDMITTETNIAKNWTAGVKGEVGDLELFGKKFINLGLSLGVEYNNYTGVGTNMGISAGLNFAISDNLKFTPGLGLSSNSANGLSISPSIGLSSKLSDQGTKSNNLGLSVGSSFNSRSGLSALTIGVSLTATENAVLSAKIKGDQILISSRSGGGSGALGASTSFDLQQPTYTPTVTNSMNSFSISGRFAIGAEAFGLETSFALSAYYSEQALANNSISSPAYGYLYSDAGQLRTDARHDFNREKDGSYTPSTPNLPLTNYTYDIYSVSGQGVGGSYRPFRNQIGYVYDNTANSYSGSVPINIEPGVGAVFHVGGSAGITYSNSQSGVWADQNNAKNSLNFLNKENKVDFENVVFREANEASVWTDPAYYQLFGEDDAVKLSLLSASKFDVYAMPQLQGTSGFSSNISRNYKKGRVKRSSTIQHLTIEEVNKGFGLENFIPLSAATTAKPHHIGQIISLGNDGLRYVYGQPAYNMKQEEVTFAVGKTLQGNTGGVTINYTDGLVGYPSGANSTGNSLGLDNYYQRVSTPAYAHSYLLTAVVSDDYVDADNIKGPSDGDLGTYTKFSYDNSVKNYKWRVPVEANQASYNEGLKSDVNDDKANYLYGEKELFYLDTIQTKNYIAIFEKENRDDGLGVNGENGGVNSGVRQKLLRRILLYTKPDYRANGNNAIPIKVVNFEYDYSLCPSVPNSVGNVGKLTLKKIYFTYRDSKKGKLNPYVFTYKNNYPYNLKAYDRWGNYKPGPTSNTNNYNDALPSYEYPYVEQSNSSLNDYATAWTLSKIELPSGGEINIETEADDYAYVQDKKALEMVKIVDVKDDPNSATLNTGIYNASLVNNKKLFFEMQSGKTIDDYVGGINDLYYRCLMEFKDGHDYVSGYAKILHSGNTGNLGWVELEPVDWGDSPSGNMNPILMAAVQFSRLHLPRQAWNSPTLTNSSFGMQFVQSLWSSLSGFITGFQNPNQTAFGNGNGENLVINKSWIRLNDVDNKKYGGGHRVSRIEIKDNWDVQTDQAMNFSKYGQVYEYKNSDGSSSGVASYEPQMGGDENPWKQPIPFSSDKKWAPDERFYQETPFGESFFPSASVGYSKVTVRNLPHSGVIRNSTGYVEHTFYTAKDFPTIAKRTTIDRRPGKNGPFSISSLTKIKVKDYLTVSQGFVVETNDMHGKPKGQKVYAQGETQPISKVEYNYKQVQGSGVSTSRLDNNVTFIEPDGDVINGLMGVNFDMVADFRESKNNTFTSTMDFNTDGIPIAFIMPVPIITIWPSFQSEKTQFRSTVLTKVVQKFGVLESTVATDLGSNVETRNIAYDAETGQVLLTQTTTNFNDKVYTFNYPAYWYYDNMGLAYKNMGFNMSGTINGAGVLTTGNAPYFIQGDEVALMNGGTNLKAWVVATTNNTVTFELASGVPPTGSFSQIKVIRSGRRNLSSQMMANLTLLSNPLNSVKNNIYENVLQASAIEYTDEWRTYCDCNDNENLIVSTNPFFLGIKGNFKPKVSYLHLSHRDQSDYNDNTNIRKDGTFESYRPFYKLGNAGKWIIDRQDWTFTSEVTEFNPFGQELENRDALGRYSAATFGFNQTLPKSVAANSRYRETGFTSFEDDNFSECADNHFKFENKGLGLQDVDAHSGKYSVKVDPSNSASLKRDLFWCDQSGCQLAFKMTYNADQINITLTGFTGQYTADFQIISGNPLVVLNSSGFNIVLSLGDFVMDFNAVDEIGCQATYRLTYENGVPVLIPLN